MDELNKNTSVLGTPLNRAYNVDGTINNATDNVEEFFTVTLETIDTALFTYFENVIRPQVLENGQIVKVPIIYGSPERWKAVQVDGFFRDNKAKIMTPLIMFKRNSIAKNENMPVDKLDANNPHNYYTVQRKYTQKNRFDQFDVLVNQAPVREFYNVVIPDYIIATYDVIVWTTLVSQMNSIIESLVYASDAYWGDKDNFKFRTAVSDISTPVEITTEAARAVKSTFTLVVNGYLIPNTINRILSTAGDIVKKSLSIKKIVMFTEVDNIPSDMFTAGAKDIKQPVNATVSTTPPIIYGGGGGGGEGTSATVSRLLTYLNKQYAKVATSIVPNVGDGTTKAIFASTNIATPPAEYPQGQSTKENFMFFVNGQYIEHSAIVLFNQVGGNTELTVDISNLGFAFDVNDEIVAVGKFNA